MKPEQKLTAKNQLITKPQTTQLDMSSCQACNFFIIWLKFNLLKRVQNIKLVNMLHYYTEMILLKGPLLMQQSVHTYYIPVSPEYSPVLSPLGLHSCLQEHHQFTRSVSFNLIYKSESNSPLMCKPNSRAVGSRTCKTLFLPLEYCKSAN